MEPNGDEVLLPPPSHAAERLRVQELLRYFQPPSPSIDNERPQIALDTSLTAYAQLSALKLNCQRSFISLIDHEKQYIIAEATRTISLHSEDIRGCEDDALYLGSTTLDLDFGVCPSTIKLFTATDSTLEMSTTYVNACKSYYVMSDLSKIPDLDGRPYVIGWPYMRYYAEVPIHSPSGLTIGSLCVVDDKPREGVNMKDIDALQEIAHAVMNHLELVTSKVQRKRAERMIQGLGLFVEGSSSLRQWWIDSETNHPTVDPLRRQLTIREQADKEFGTRQDSTVELETQVTGSKAETEYSTLSEPLNIEDSITGVLALVSTEPIEIDGGDKTVGGHAVRSAGAELQKLSIFSNGEPFASIPTSSNSSGKQSPRQWSSRQNSASTNTTSRRETPFRSDLEEMLDRATNLIREAIGLNGVMFLAPRDGRGHLQPQQDIQKRMKSKNVEAREAKKNEAEQTTLESIDTPGASINSSKGPLSQDKMCNILAFSTYSGLDISDSGISRHPLAISDTGLRQITELFPKGGVLKFDGEGLVSCSELEFAWYNDVSRVPRHLSFTGEQSIWNPSSDVSRSTVAQELSHVLSGVRSVILFPLWNSSRDKLFAYNVAWTIDPTRVFQREDFAYLASFGNSIMAELSRIDTIAADRAKADFISSISHELRSPLHGVLASSELLKALTRDNTSIDIINTIDACGSTLLDTMENLLAFAKINNFTFAQQRKKATITAPNPEEGPLQPLKSLTADIDLGNLVEEVMNANISGHQFRKSLETHPAHTDQITTADANFDEQDNVMVICDIEPEVKWLFNTQAGAWKRILMNLLGNSLKYTTKGYIQVKLSQEKSGVSPYDPSKIMVHLLVKDSGKGIAENYLKHHLFTPFKQEDPLCSGTGLGLSIVHQLVRSIDGDIEVISEVGHGTNVTVSVLLERSPESTAIEVETDILAGALSKLEGCKVGLVSLDVYPDFRKTTTGFLSKQSKRGQVLKSAFIRALESLGMQSGTVASLDSDLTDIDMLMITESQFLHVRSAAQKKRQIPLIVLCGTLTLDYRSVSNVNGPVVYLSQPFGPRKLAKALQSCIPFLDHASGMKPGYQDTLEPPLSKHIAVNTKLDKLAQDLTRSPLDVIPKKNASGQVPAIKSRARVLLVEDNPINLKLLVTFIEKLGYSFSTATDGLQAVAAYQRVNGEIDVIFMDIQMPNMDGMAASYEIRKFELENSLPRTMIVALTGLASAEAQEQSALSGIDLFLTKPVPLKTLRAVIEERFPVNG